MVYNKLVRDKIPEIIIKDGHKCDFTYMKDSDYEEALKQKLVEEAKEFAESGNIEELADIFEVVGCILDVNGWTYDKVYQVALDKEKERGSFYDKVFLVSVDE